MYVWICLDKVLADSFLSSSALWFLLEQTLGGPFAVMLEKEQSFIDCTM